MMTSFKPFNVKEQKTVLLIRRTCDDVILTVENTNKTEGDT
jgi:hypothetical protein